MSFLSRLFSKNAEDCLAKGDRLLLGQNFFEARTAYEEGEKIVLGKAASPENDALLSNLRTKIIQANRALAGLNILEAEYAIAGNAFGKAKEYLELAKTLTDDVVVLEKAASLSAGLAAEYSNMNEEPPASAPVSTSGCNSCASNEPSAAQAAFEQQDPGLSDMDYYDLLIRQLPGEMYSRYAVLGEKFAFAYLASSRDDHAVALELLEKWHDGSCCDIYCYEKGMILHRLGNIVESEACLLDAIKENASNPLPHLGLALLLIEERRMEEAATQLDAMIASGTMAEQAILMRGDLCLHAGDSDGAISRYGMLLATPLARPAAEKLHEALMQCGRHQEAEAVFKQYLKKGCGGH